jgi:hypothetical protein
MLCSSSRIASLGRHLLSGVCGEERTELLDKKHHKALKEMEVQSADGERCGFDDVELVRVKVTPGGFKPVHA